ncbi:unnamed protein product [Discosporangium mesarthrocarpum]
MAMTRCFFVYAGTTKSSLWPEAVQTAVYIRNRSPSAFLRGRIPFEVWTGRIPTSSFESIGSSSFRTCGNTQNKAAPQGLEGRFVGYSIDSPAYLVWRPGTIQFFRSRNVTIINELTFQPQDQMQVSTNGSPPVEIGHLDEVVIDTNYTLTTLTSDTVVTCRPCPLLIYWGQMKRMSRTHAQLQDSTSSSDAVAIQAFPDDQFPLSIGSAGIPLTYEEATNSSDAEGWHRATIRELQKYRISTPLI